MLRCFPQHKLGEVRAIVAKYSEELLWATARRKMSFEVRGCVHSANQIRNSYTYPSTTPSMAKRPGFERGFCVCSSKCLLILPCGHRFWCCVHVHHFLSPSLQKHQERLLQCNCYDALLRSKVERNYRSEVRQHAACVCARRPTLNNGRHRQLNKYFRETE